MGSLRVGHDWATSLSLFTFVRWRRKWQPTPVVLPGESQDGGAWRAAVCGVAQCRTRLKRLSSSSKHESIHTPRSLSRQKTSSWSLTLSLSSSLLLEEGRAWDTPFPRQSRPSGTGGLVAVCERGQVVRVGTGYSHLKIVASPALLLCTQLYPALEEDPSFLQGARGPAT